MVARPALNRIFADLRLLKTALSPSPERSSEGTILTYAIAERLQEILPAGEFELKTNGKTINIKGIGPCRGSSYSTAPWLLYNMPTPVPDRLALIFRTQSQGVQRFISRARHAPWPAPGAEAHTRITAEAVAVWWGGPDEADAVIRWRPFLLDELASR